MCSIKRKLISINIAALQPHANVYNELDTKITTQIENSINIDEQTVGEIEEFNKRFTKLPRTLAFITLEVAASNTLLRAYSFCNPIDNEKIAETIIKNKALITELKKILRGKEDSAAFVNVTTSAAAILESVEADLDDLHANHTEHGLPLGEKAVLAKEQLLLKKELDKKA